ncbi:MAG TPA: hypothetical protein VGU45_06745 [Microvirga sp.]|jgi:hypothetical protein|nr:hypothetical protein [Microvirga sp.]
MQDLYEQYGHGQTLLPKKRGFGLPVVLASGATALALAGFFTVAALSRNEAGEPLPPRSTPLEVAKAPIETVTGSLPAATRPAPAPAEKPALADKPAVAEKAPAVETPLPKVTEVTPAAALPAPAPAPVTALIQAQPAPEPKPAPTLVASAEIPVALPSPIPPMVAPTPPAPVAAAPAPAPQAPAAATAPAPKPKAGPSASEISLFTGRARDLIKSGDIAGARLLLERAASGEDGPALLALAETYDPAVLGRWGVVGVRPDVERARSLYQKAAERGVSAAKERILALR